MRLIMATAPAEKAKSIAKVLVIERLAACVNIAPAIRSIYTWQGKVEDEEEALLLIKSTAQMVEQLTTRLRELHPYDVPEIISLKIAEDEGNAAYLDWVRKSVGSSI